MHGEHFRLLGSRQGLRGPNARDIPVGRLVGTSELELGRYLLTVVGQKSKFRRFSLKSWAGNSGKHFSDLFLIKSEIFVHLFNVPQQVRFKTKFKSILGSQLWQAIDRSQGSREERPKLQRWAAESWSERHLAPVRIQQRRQPVRHQLRQHTTHVKLKHSPVHNEDILTVIIPRLKKVFCQFRREDFFLFLFFEFAVN